jgi:hypothetical protein
MAFLHFKVHSQVVVLHLMALNENNNAYYLLNAMLGLNWRIYQALLENLQRQKVRFTWLLFLTNMVELWEYVHTFISESNKLVPNHAV